MKIIAEFIEILLDDRPAFPGEFCIKTMRTRRFVGRERLDYIINFLRGKRLPQEG
jgi:hypothetical protein